MKRTAYDVVVIGAGPAGSIAARTCAQAGLQVLLAEKRQEIGSPVRCAEAVGKDTVAEFISLDPQWIAAEIGHYSLVNSLGDTIHFPQYEPTLVLERKIFDRELAHSAADAGAEVIVKARAAGFIKNGTGLEGVKLVVQGKPCEVRCKIVIGADGTEAQSTRWAGLKSNPQLKDYYSAAQYQLTNVNVDQQVCQYHLGWSIAPAGYAWVFPKGKNTANVGLVIAVDPKQTRSAIDCLNDFVAKNFPQSSILSQVVGGIPITNVLPEMTAAGYLAVGDAAHQSDPMTAGGITNGMYGGLFAAQTAIEALRQGDTSRQFLKQYEKMWDDKFGADYRRLYRLRRAIFKIPEEKINSMIKQVSQLDSKNLTLAQMFKIFLKEYPLLVVDTLPLLLGK
ncbi:digeranylgeranylglycerophospholipid reductase [Thermoflexales bacterium]|nr:digeranylgeranylglycerophospholipid reductase [Thermoflexales bacterium]